MVARTKDAQGAEDMLGLSGWRSLLVSGQSRRISRLQALQNEFTLCNERMLGWPPAAGVRRIVFFLVILAVVKNRVTLLRCAHRLPGSVGLSSHRMLVAGRALDAVLRAA